MNNYFCQFISCTKIEMYSACIDGRTSKLCRELDGKTFKVKDGKPGKNLPPMHPFCRSTTLAVLPYEEDLDKAFEDFKVDNIPEGMDFDEWLDGLEPTEDGKLVFRVGKNNIAENDTEKHDFDVNKDKINSSEYRTYFDGLFKSEKANSCVCRETKRAIQLNANTDNENYSILNGGNSGSHKKGVSRTYKNFDGYAPIFAYIGTEGYLCNAELREGSRHCQCETPEFLAETISAAKQMTDKPLLFRIDSGRVALCQRSRERYFRMD